MSVIYMVWPRQLFTPTYSTVLLDKNGELLGASIAKDEQWRFPPRSNIPEKFIQAITCYEDRRFFYHTGVDPLAIARAMWLNIKHRKIVSGASTITMQVIRLSRQHRSRTVREKLIEMLLAFKLELFTHKKDILTLFASHAPFGGNIVGIEAAAWRYFGREPKMLSWAEVATLAVLPNNPAMVHPGKNREILKQKRDTLLDRLHKDGAIDSLTCKLAKSEPLPSKPHPLPRTAPHLLTRELKIKDQLRNKITSFNIDINTLFRIRTTIDKNIQAEANDIVRRHHYHLSKNKIHNAAALILDVETGNVLAYVGNVFDPNSQQHSNHVDIITSRRSTGSILKPFLYAGMLQTGEILPSELVPDIPIRMGGFAPQNYSRTYNGAIPAYMALARSLNVPAVRMLFSFGVDRFYHLLKKLGIQTLHRPASEYGLSLILGGAEGTLWDITGMYAAMARTVNNYAKRSKAPAPYFFQPNYLLDHKNLNRPSINHFSENPLDAPACWLTFQAMLEVVRPGEDASWRSFSSSQKIAWKTGTSYGYRDGWAVGITPKFAIGVWVGNADGEGRPELTGIATAAPILFELFGMFDTSQWFDSPEAGLIDIEVCSRSGFRAGPNCSHTKKISITHPGLKTRPCPYCTIIHCDKTKTWRIHGQCDRIANIQAEKWFVLPPAIEWYYKQKHSDYYTLPPFRKDCAKTGQESRGTSLSLVSPGKDSIIYIPIELTGMRGKTVFMAAHRNVDSIIYWHLDGQYLGATRDIHQMEIAPAPGRHILTLVDENGERFKRKFTVLSKE